MSVANMKRRARLHLLLPEPERLVMLTPALFARGAALELLGFKAADALHVAADDRIACFA